MDLRRSSLPASDPVMSSASTLAIPSARTPFQALSPSPRAHPLPGSPHSGAANAAAAARRRHLINLAEGAFVLVGLYILLGAGIGDVAGSVLIGVTSGLVAGLCAVAAILLICGSARASAEVPAERLPSRP